ncbi:hypothetical protein ACHAWF_010032 [Thalassiosira exigua]
MLVARSQRRVLRGVHEDEELPDVEHPRRKAFRRMRIVLRSRRRRRGLPSPGGRTIPRTRAELFVHGPKARRVSPNPQEEAAAVLLAEEAGRVDRGDRKDLAHRRTSLDGLSPLRTGGVFPRLRLVEPHEFREVSFAGTPCINEALAAMARSTPHPSPPRSPCHYPSDDLVFGSGIEVSVASPDATESAPAEPRPCSLDDERLDVSDGRWVRRPYPDNETCTPLVQDPAYAAFRTFRPEYRGDRDPRCWHRDDLTQVATTCAEPGCRWVIDHRWTTRLKRESRWYGMWESRECAYRDMGDDAIQNCVESKNIASVKVEGMSIANIVKGYLDQKLRNITFPKEGTLNVTLNTLKISHVIWHHPIDEYRETLEKDFVDVSANDAEEHYWITGFYFTSEREPHVLVDRSLQFSKMAWDVLTPKGYKMINALDVTSAFAFDTDGQADGLHIGGPPIRAVVTKFFHHLCHDVGSVSGDAVERS